MMEKICGKGEFWAWNETVNVWWRMRVVSRWEVNYRVWHHQQGVLCKVDGMRQEKRNETGCWLMFNGTFNINRLPVHHATGVWNIFHSAMFPTFYKHPWNNTINRKVISALRPGLREDNLLTMKRRLQKSRSSQSLGKYQNNQKTEHIKTKANVGLTKSGPK